MHPHDSTHYDRNGVGIYRHLVQVEKNPETVLEVSEEMEADPASHTKEVTKLKKLSHQLTGMAGRRLPTPPWRRVDGGGEVMRRCTPDLK
jgi:hypothetical protein